MSDWSKLSLRLMLLGVGPLLVGQDLGVSVGRGGSWGERARLWKTLRVPLRVRGGLGPFLLLPSEPLLLPLVDFLATLGGMPLVVSFWLTGVTANRGNIGQPLL